MEANRQKRPPSRESDRQPADHQLLLAYGHDLGTDEHG